MVWLYLLKISILKKILLLSDTHSWIDDKILKWVHQVDEVWHAGDIGDLKVTDAIAAIKPLRAVYGNIDDSKARVTFPENLIFFVEEVKVVMTHIAGSPGKYPARIKELLKNEQPKILVCGHSHILKVQMDAAFSCLHMNPGAVGKHGFHVVRTMLRFEIDGEKIQNLEVIEIPK